MAPFQEADHLLHYRPIHLSRGLDLFQLPLQCVHVTLQYHRFHVGRMMTSGAIGSNPGQVQQSPILFNQILALLE